MFERLGRFVKEVRAAYISQGALIAARVGVRKITGICRRSAAYLGETAIDHKVGMRTRGVVRNESILRGRGSPDGNHYQAISVRGFREVLSAADVDPAAASFLDLGAGRGRALLLAAEMGFGRVIGVELDPDCARDAAANIRSWEERHSPSARPRPGRFELRVGDAAEAEFPEGGTVVFLYNPFGPATMSRVLARASAAQRRGCGPMTFCYFNPVHASLVDGSDEVVVRSKGSHWMVFDIASPSGSVRDESQGLSGPRMAQPER